MAILALKPERLDAGEFNDQPVSICGKSFRADYSGALYWPAVTAMRFFAASEPAMASTGTITPKRPNHIAMASRVL